MAEHAIKITRLFAVGTGQGDRRASYMPAVELSQACGKHAGPGNLRVGFLMLGHFGCNKTLHAAANLVSELRNHGLKRGASIYTHARKRSPGNKPHL